MKQKKTTHLVKASYRTLGLVFLLISVITTAFSFQYYYQLQAAILGESEGYLMEISRRIGSNVNQIIDDNYASLYILSSTLTHAEVDSFGGISPLVEAQKRQWDYEHILFVGENGKAFDDLGREVVLNNDSYFGAVQNKQQGLSTTQMIDNKEYIMLTVPFEDVTLSGNRIVGLAGTYLPSVFENTLSMNSFNGQAYSCVMNNTGTIVIRPNISGDIKLGYNVLSSIGEAKLDEGDSIDAIKQDISNNIDGQIGFTQNGVRYYMVYAPINEDGWYLTMFVPSHVVNEKSEMLLTVTLIMCGIIAATFSGLIIVLIYVFYRNKKELEKIAYVDEVTGGHTIQKFYFLAQEAMDVSEHPQYALIYANLQKFKLLNEQFGRRNCDAMLQMFYEIVDQNLTNKECIGRLSADNFCILIDYETEEELLRRLLVWYASAERYMSEAKPSWPLPVAEFGVYIIDNDALPFPQIIDRAKLALREFSRHVNSKIRFAIYNNDTHNRLIREKQLEDRMEHALINNEFQVYFQPKYHLPEECIGGAEALVRWQSPQEGMIYPGEFIPLFEKNGFIVHLDLWMFEQVCKCLRGWLDQGWEPVKISVNCSRVQLNNANFLDAYRDITEKYRISPKLLEIELTESIVMEDSERLSKIIDDIHAIGFGCSMDDFGSGYSSLNLLQSISVDTLKLDGIFFRAKTKDSSRMESVVTSIVGMAKALSITTVAEGVEYPEQVKMLSRIGCDYIQGYVFAKPMPVEAFEEAAFGGKQDREGERAVEK